MALNMSFGSSRYEYEYGYSLRTRSTLVVEVVLLCFRPVRYGEGGCLRERKENPLMIFVCAPSETSNDERILLD